MRNIFVITLISVGHQFIFSELLPDSADHCGSQMENYRQCIKKGLDTGAHGSTKLTLDDRKKLQSDVEQCFLNEKCKSPFLAKDYQEVAKTCFQSIRNASRTELQNCVHHDVSDFVLPQDESGSLEMRQAAVALLLAIKSPYSLCPLWVNKTKLAECIKEKSSHFEQKSSSTEDLCQVRQNCDKQISGECSAKWNNRAIPSLCKCVNDNKLNLVQKYKQYYTKCMQEKKLNMHVNDPTPYVIESNIKGWCPATNAKNPCADFKATTNVQSKAPVLTTLTTRRPLPNPPPKSKFNPEQVNNGSGDGSDGDGQSTDSVDGGLPPTLLPFQTDAATDTIMETTTTTSTTTTEMMSTTSDFQNQDIFSALMQDPVFQNIIGSNPTLAFFQNLFSGKTDLSSIFPSATLLGNFQGGLSNLFGNVGQPTGSVG